MRRSLRSRKRMPRPRRFTRILPMLATAAFLTIATPNFVGCGNGGIKAQDSGQLAKKSKETGDQRVKIKRKKKPKVVEVSETYEFVVSCGNLGQPAKNGGFRYEHNFEEGEKVPCSTDDEGYYDFPFLDVKAHSSCDGGTDFVAPMLVGDGSTLIFGLQTGDAKKIGEGYRLVTKKATKVEVTVLGKKDERKDPSSYWVQVGGLREKKSSMRSVETCSPSSTFRWNGRGSKLERSLDNPGTDENIAADGKLIIRIGASSGSRQNRLFVTKVVVRVYHMEIFEPQEDPKPQPVQKEAPKKAEGRKEQPKEQQPQGQPGFSFDQFLSSNIELILAGLALIATIITVPLVLRSRRRGKSSLKRGSGRSEPDDDWDV